MSSFNSAINYLKHPSRVFYREYWSIGLLNTFTLPQSPEKIADALHSHDITWLYPENPADFIADPFITTYFDEPMLFFERMDSKKRKGNISYAKISELLHDSEHAEKYFHLALELDTHLSYPYMFEYNEKLYMVPENYQSHGISLYKAGDKPNQWTKVSTLIDNFDGVDTNIFKHDDVWWMFSTLRTEGTPSENTDLYIWYAENPLGEWTLHPSSPIHYDDASARGAGKPFEIDGVLYRPTQDCSEKYGGKLNIKQIVKLDKQSFVEGTVDTIDGIKPCEHALHTFSFSDGVGVIDGGYGVYKVGHIVELGKAVINKLV